MRGCSAEVTRQKRTTEEKLDFLVADIAVVVVAGAFVVGSVVVAVAVYVGGVVVVAAAAVPEAGEFGVVTSVEVAAEKRVRWVAARAGVRRIPSPAKYRTS